MWRRARSAGAASGGPRLLPLWGAQSVQARSGQHLGISPAPRTGGRAPASRGAARSHAPVQPAQRPACRRAGETLNWKARVSTTPLAFEPSLSEAACFCLHLEIESPHHHVRDAYPLRARKYAASLCSPDLYSCGQEALWHARRRACRRPAPRFPRRLSRPFSNTTATASWNTCTTAAGESGLHGERVGAF